MAPYIGFVGLNFITVMFPSTGVAAEAQYWTVTYPSHAVTARTNPVAGTGAIYDVAWNGQVFCVIAAVGCYTSTNGIDWIAGGSMGAVYTVIKASTTTGKMMVFTPTGTTVAVSVDNGVSWTPQTLPAHADGAVTYRVLGNSSNIFALQATKNYGAGVFANFFAVTSPGGTVVGTPVKMAGDSDGEFPRQIYSFNDTLVLAVGGNLGTEGYYYNGSTWTVFTGSGDIPTLLPAGINASYAHIAWNGTKACSKFQTAGPVYRMTANTDTAPPPTSAWAKTNIADMLFSPFPIWWNGVEFFSAVMVGNRGDTVVVGAYSADGINWTQLGAGSGPGWCGASGQPTVY